jgi:hypothetical protein
MASIRQRLGLTQGGAKALSVLAMMSGSDYDLDGAQGVGSVGGLALARHLLQGDSGDGRVLERLAALVQVGGGWQDSGTYLAPVLRACTASSKDVGMIAAGQLEACSAWWDTGNIKLVRSAPHAFCLLPCLGSIAEPYTAAPARLDQVHGLWQLRPRGKPGGMASCRQDTCALFIQSNRMHPSSCSNHDEFCRVPFCHVCFCCRAGGSARSSATASTTPAPAAQPTR